MLKQSTRRYQHCRPVGRGTAAAKKSPAQHLVLTASGCDMSGIHSIGNNSPVQKVVTQPIQKQLPAQPAKQMPVADKLQLSGVSHMLATLKANDVRGEKVAAIKSQIDAGTYESDAKLDAAVN